MNLEMTFGGITLMHAFDTLGLDQGEMNLQGFKYHREILRRMRRDDPGKAADAKSVRGLFKISRKGQDMFQDFFFPSKPRSPAQAKIFDAVVTFANATDRLLRERAPA
jgi:hypothetical protein